MTELQMGKRRYGNPVPSVQCIYAAVTLIVYIGGMAKYWPAFFSREISSTASIVREPEQAASAAQLQKAEGAEVAQQAPQPPMVRPAAGLQPQGNDDEDWELLHASALPDAGSEASLAQCSPDDEPDPLPKADALPGGRQQDAQEGSAANASAQGPIGAAELLRDAQHSSSGKQHEGANMRAETDSQSLIHPRSASTAAQLSKTLGAEASSRQDRHSDGTTDGQASQDHELLQPKAGKHGQPQQRPGSPAAASGSAEPAAFDRREVLWRCAIFTLQVR